MSLSSETEPLEDPPEMLTYRRGAGEQNDANKKRGREERRLPAVVYHRLPESEFP
ncbi:hypothetical protein YC2023_023749 [Brassica napus]